MSPRITAALLLLALSAVLAPVRGAPTLLHPRHQGHDDNTTTENNTQKQNALDAQKLNAKFASLKATDACSGDEIACIKGSFAQCTSGKWTLTPCVTNLRCYGLPLINNPGTTLSCTTETDALLRFESAGVQGGTTGITSNSPSDKTTDTTNDEEGDDCEDDDEGDEGDEDCEDDGDVDGDDDEDCEDDGDDDEVTTSAIPRVVTVTKTVTPTPASTQSIASLVTDKANSGNENAGYRRQLVSSAGSTNPSVVVVTATATAVPESRVVTSTVTLPVTATASTQVDLPTSVSSGLPEPTGIVLGPDGIRTVTVVSTVTVCGASTVAPTSSAAVPTTNLPSESSVFSSPPILSTITVTVVPSSTTVSSSATGLSSSVIPLSSSVPASFPSGIFSGLPSTVVTDVSATPRPTNNGGFSFSNAPVPTPAPEGGISGSSIDVAKQITATL